MAKKDKKAKKAGGEKLLPKRIAGVKIPKALRQQADHLVALARDPAVSKLLIAGIASIAAGVVEKEKVRAAASAAKRKAAEAAQDAGEAVAGAAAPVEDAVKPAPRRTAATTSRTPRTPRTTPKAPPTTAH